MKTITVILFLVFSGMVYGQTQKTYDLAIGLRGSGASGITLKYKMEKNTALEGILGVRLGNNGYALTGLYEIQNQNLNVDNLEWYYGGGGHVGMDDDGGTVIGADLILGMEYTIGGTPVNLSVDWKPAIDIIRPANYKYPGYGEAGLSLRFVIK